jgi:beta-N-acetylhexosaminidase
MSTSDHRHSSGNLHGRRRVAVAAIVLAVASCATACDASQVNWHAAVQPGNSAPLPTPVNPTPSPSAVRPSPPEPSHSATSAEDSCVSATVAKLTVRQLAGQVMLVGTPLTDTASIDATIRTYDIGGVFLSGRSTASAGTLRGEITALQKTAKAEGSPGLFISLDQEGGEVQTLKGSSFPPIPTALAQGKLSTSTLYSQTVSWSKRLASIGVTLDLAPVSDTVATSLGTKNPPIGAFYRQYGSDPTKVATDISTVVKAIQSTGVTTTLKHFPGLGRVLYNTDFSTKAVDKVATTHDPNLAPFIAGIKAGTGAVLISSASYPTLDPHTIATFSKPIVTGLLRDQLGFKGLIVSDAMGGAAAVSIVPTGQRAVRFIEAGGDLALTAQFSKAPAMIDGLIAAAQKSASFTAQLKTAATDVMRSKYSAGLLSCSPSQQ